MSYYYSNASMPQGVRLEDGIADEIDDLRDRLQSLRGSSGSADKLGDDSDYSGLQSLRGSSGRPPPAKAADQNPILQSLRGSSGSRPRSGSASCRRPFNPSGVRLEDSGLPLTHWVIVPSIPQGFVWKRERHTDLRPEEPPSIPQGFVWKGACCSGVRPLLCPSVPQGFVWKPIAHEAEPEPEHGDLQSLRGSSGSVLRSRPLGHLQSPSIPQGFVWKEQRQVFSNGESGLQSLRGSSGSHAGILNETRPLPSIPQGFVWKSPEAMLSSTLSTLQSLRGSSGSRLKNRVRRLEQALQSLRGSSGRLGLVVVQLGRRLPSIPQGFVWKCK